MNDFLKLFTNPQEYLNAGNQKFISVFLKSIGLVFIGLFFLLVHFFVFIAPNINSQLFATADEIIKSFPEDLNISWQKNHFKIISGESYFLNEDRSPKVIEFFNTSLSSVIKNLPNQNQQFLMATIVFDENADNLNMNSFKNYFKSFTKNNIYFVISPSSYYIYQPETDDWQKLSFTNYFDETEFMINRSELNSLLTLATPSINSLSTIIVILVPMILIIVAIFDLLWQTLLTSLIMLVISKIINWQVNYRKIFCITMLIVAMAQSINFISIALKPELFWINLDQIAVFAILSYLILTNREAWKEAIK